MKKKASLLVFSAVSGALVSGAIAAPITSGDLVVYRVGTGSAALTSASTAVFLDEYTPTGSLVQSIPLPTATSGSNNPLTSSGTATSEGGLTLSGNGQDLLLTGYDSAPGVASIASSATTAVPREVGVVDLYGNVDTTTTTTAFNGNNIRSAASQDGNTLYATGATTGVISLTRGGSGAGTLLNSTVTNDRQVEVYNNQLYVDTGSGSTYRIAAVGSGLPTTTGQTLTEQSPVGSATAINTAVAGAYAYLFTTLDNATTPDVLYVADNSYNFSTGSASSALGAIEKFTLNSGVYTLDGTVALAGVTGLTGVPTLVSGVEEENLYATTPTGIYALTDTGAAAALGGTPSLVVSAGTNEAFRGIVAVPEPLSSSLLVCGAAALLLRRRRSTMI